MCSSDLGRRWGHSIERTAARHCRAGFGDEAEALSSESVYEVRLFRVDGSVPMVDVAERFWRLASKSSILFEGSTFALILLGTYSESMDLCPW